MTEPASAAGYTPGDLCADHPDHFMPCSKCAGADCCGTQPEKGTCVLCGQEMLRTADDCWHPYFVARACPPESSEGGFSQPEWGKPGRPGREHFRVG